MNPRFRPHLKQRFTIRDENFGFLLLRATVDVFAIPELVINVTRRAMSFAKATWVNS